MSKTIDQRVVEMQFDNRNFERNVSTTMSSVEKLKQSLNFTGAAKGLENVSSAARKVDMNGLGSAVETVRTRFSALEVMGVTALANITNSAVNAGKRMLSALTIDPVLTGFQEYETQMNAIQTIMANTSSKGTTLDDVTAALDELNQYADQTIYNFTEMTRNIGTFTAAGVDLDKSVTSIKGIANLAAVSGSNSQQAATAMYQLSQALAAGKVQLMDWNSVVNAGMGGELFQNALIRTATQMGTNVDALIKKYGSFRESLTKGEWLTAEVLTETLTQLSGAYTEADLIAQGYTEKQAKEIVELANTAVGAATDVKTFTQLWDTMKESVTSGWAQTWQIIIGDFEEAKEFFTELSGIFGGIIQTFSDARNNLLAGALGSPWDNLTKKINEAGISTEKFESAVIQTAKDQGIAIDDLIAKHGSLAKAFQAGALKPSLIIDSLKRFTSSLKTTSGATTEVADKLEYFNTVVGKVIRGDFGNGAERIEALTKAGYDNVVVQKLVNKIWERNGQNWSNTTLTAEELTDAIGDLSVAEMESIGFTKEEATAIQDLAKQAEEAGTPLNELINNLSKPSGRELLLDSVLNIINSIVNSAKAIGAAWQEIFPPMEATGLYSMIEGFNNFTKTLEVNTEVADKITRTFRGLFSILDIFTTIIGGGFKIAFEVLSAVLGAFNLDILDFTAMVGDAAYNLRNFLLNNELVTKGIRALATGIVSGVSAIREWIDAFRQLPSVQAAIDGIRSSFQRLKEIGINAIEELKTGLQSGLTSLPQLLMEVGQNAIAGLQNGFGDGLRAIPNLLMELGQRILDAIKNVLGIHSPSTEMYEVGKFSIEGLVNGFRDGISTVIGALRELIDAGLQVLKDAPWGSFIAAGITIGLVKVTSDLVGVVSAFAAPMEGLGDLLSGVGSVLDESAKSISKVIKSFSKVMNSYALSIKAGALKSIAIAIGILAASVFVLAQLDAAKLWSSIGAIAALAVVLGTLSVAIGKFGPDKALSFSGFALAVVGISASLLIMASAMKKLSSINPDQYVQTLTGFVAIVGSMVAIVAAYGKLVTGPAAANIAKVGTMMLGLSASMILMIGVIKLISGLSADELIKGGVAITAFMGIVGMLAVITNISRGTTAKLGSTMIQLSVAMGLMVGVIKLISGLSVGELVKGGVAITGFVAILGLLTVITNFGTGNATKLGTTLLAMSSSMLIMVGVVKLISGMSAGEIIKGQAAILAFTGIIALLSASVKLAGKDASRIGATLLAMSLSIGILAGIAVVLSFIDLGGMAKGLTVVGILSTFMAALIIATKNANDVKGNLIVMTVAIGVLAAAVAALSFIEPTALAGATAAMSILMGMFALIIKSTNSIKTSMSTLIVMSAAIAVLGGVIFALAQLPIESTLGVAVSLSTLLLAISAAMKILGTVKSVSASALAALATVSLIMAGLAALLNLIGPLDAASSIETAISLGTLLTVLSGVTALLAGVGKLGAGAALQGVLALSGVIAVLAVLMGAIGGLVTYFPQLEEFVNKGIGLLETLAYGIGSIVGNLVGGLMAGVTSGLPEVGTNLSTFMDNLQPFIDGVSKIDADAVNAVGSLGSMILSLTAANILDGIASFITGKSSLEKFGEEIVPFGTAMANFAKEVKGIDGDDVTAAANAGLALAQMADTIPKQGGVLQNFFGSTDLEAFGTQLEAFGGAIVGFSDKIAEGNFSSETVTAATNAGLALAELATKIPKQGGVFQDFLGTQDLGTFGSQLELFGEGISKFSNKIAEGNFSSELVTAAANAGLAMAELATKLPKQGGVLQDFFGTQDLGTFGSQLESFGKAIVGFSDELSKGDITPETVSAAANAGLALADLANKLPKQNGIFQNFFGTQDLSVFGTQLSTFGKKFGEYADYVKDVDPDVVSATAHAARSLVTLADSLPDNKLFVNETTLDEFGSQLAGFGSYFAQYYENISGINTYKLTGVVDEIWRLIDLSKGMSGLDTGSMRSFSSALTQLGKTGIDGFVSAFENSTGQIQSAVNAMLTAFVTTTNARKKELSTTFVTLVSDILSTMNKQTENFKMVAKTFGDSLANGFKEKEQAIRSAINLTMANMISSIRGRYDDFRSAGRYMVDGMISGMNDRRSNANSAARSLASSVVTSMKKELDIHSPSGVTRDEVGHWIVEGLAEGITENMTAEEAASKKAQNITNAFQSELSLLDLAEQTAELEAELAGTNVDYLTQQERQVRRVELAYGEYQVMLENFGETATETQEAYNKYLQEEIDLRTIATNQAEEAAQKTRETYSAQIEFIDKLREEQKASLLDELAAYKNLQRQYEIGSQERIELDEKILSLQEEIADATDEYYNSLTEIQEEANAERLQIDQDYEDQRTQIKEEANEKRLELDQEYADKTKEINDQLEADIESLEKAYEDAVNSRADTLYGSYGLFDEVTKDEEAVTGDQLMENLQGQLDAFADWTKNLNSLIDRGLDEALIEELREMGPSSAAEIAALNAMTDEQLNQYVELWRQKHELAKNQAVYELQGMREETDSEIEQLRKDAEIELEEYRATWRDQVDALDEETSNKLRDLRRNWLDQIDELDAGTQEKLKELKDDWMKSIVGLQTDTQGQFAKMTTHLINTVGDKSQWSAVGVNAIEGILYGIADRTPDLVEGVEDAMYSALRAANRVLEIRSPSRKFKEVGRYSILGMVNGLRDYAYLASDEAETAGLSMLNTLRNTIAGISDAINDNIDTQPTIRPVLDLTDLADGTKQLNTLFSRNQAVSISAGLQRRSTVTDDSDDISSNKAGNVYQFTQNNYSPKALSRVEIYRQTKNQFSAMQRTVET